MSKYLFFADESGNVTQEPGISDDIGPSRYLAMGGCLISVEEYDHVVAALADLQAHFKKTKFLHAAALSHVQKVHFARELLKLRVPVFGVVSDKTTLLGFKAKSDGPEDYYNRTALYLLNLLGRHLKQSGIPATDVSIVFEQRKHDYKRFRNYVAVVKKNPSGDFVDSIQFIEPYNIETQEKSEQPALSIPDLVANSLFAAFDRNRNNYGITEVRYIGELIDGFGDARSAERIHLIKPDRMTDICEPTVELMRSLGFKLPKA